MRYSRQRSRIASLGLLLAASLAWVPESRALDPDRPLLHAKIDVWTRREGLPSLGINRIVQGSDGYLWLATEAGLVRFDGVRFVVFDQATDPVLRSSMIEDVLALPDGKLVVATYDGLYRLERGVFQAIEIPEGRKRYTKLIRDREGRILALRSTGIDVGDDHKVVPLPLRERDGGSTRIAIREAVADASGTLWIVSDNGKRLLRWDGRSDVEEDALTASGPTTISTIASDESGNLWVVASPGGLLRFRSGRFEPMPGSFPAGFAADRLKIEKDGTVWLASFDGSLARYRSGAVDFLPGKLLAGGEVRTIGLDAEGSVWIASAGLARLRDSDVVTLSEREGWPAGSISSVLVDSRGREYVGPQVGGFLRREGGVWLPTLDGPAAAAPVLAATEDRTRTVWIGTIGSGLYWMDERDRPHLAAPDWKRDGVMGLSPCADGRCMLAGLTSGFFTVTPDRTTAAPFVPTGEINASVFCTLRDRAGNTWAGTSGAGIYVRSASANSWSRVPPDTTHGLAVLSLAEDADGTIWAGSVDGGLLRVRDGSAKSLTRRQGLPSDTIYYAIPGDGDELWLSTPVGIARASRAELGQVADDASKRAACLVLGYEDGLRAGECNGGGQVVARGPGGRLYFATPGGVAYVDPAKTRRAAAAPEALVEEFVADGKPVEIREAEPRLPAGTERCEIRFTALTLRASARTRFRYRLEGLEETWTEATGGERVARYSHPPPGPYVFRVAAASEHGDFGDAGTALRFSVAPHPWQTPWFWAIAGAGLIGAVYSAYRLRLRAFVQRQADLERAIAARTAELAETNRTLEQRVEEGIARLRDRERLAAYGEMVAGVAHEVRHPIFSIRAAAHLITKKTEGAKEEIAAPLGVLEKETGRMARLMDDLLQFARPPELSRAPLDVRSLLDEAVAAVRAADPSWSLPIHVEAGDLPKATWDHDRMLQVLVNLLENARKHAAGAKRIALRARPDGDAIAIEVEDDGAGMEPDVSARAFEPFFTRGAGTGLGLAIVARIVREHGGTIAVDSGSGRGTRFGMRIPVGYASER